MRSILIAVLISLPIAAKAQKYHYLLGQKHRYHVHESYSGLKSTQWGIDHYTETTDFDADVDVISTSDTLTELDVLTGNLNQICSQNMTMAHMVVPANVHVFVEPNGHVRRVRILQGVASGDVRQLKSRKALTAYDAVRSYFRFILPPLPALDSMRDGYHQLSRDTTADGLDSTFGHHDYDVTIDANDPSVWELSEVDVIHLTNGEIDIHWDSDINFGGVDSFPRKLESNLTAHKDGVSSEQHVKVTER